MGEQYHSVILYETEDEKATAEKIIKEVDESLHDGTRVVTQVIPIGYGTATSEALEFFPAESYHNNYFNENKSAPYCQLIIEPKIEKVKKRFTELVRQ